MQNINLPNGSPEKKTRMQALAREIKQVDQELSTLKTLDVPTLPAATSKWKSVTEGGFIPFRMDYSTKEKKPDELTNENQADKILEQVRKLKNQGYEKVGITYSANREQADKIRGAYSEGKWKVGIKGSNQAEVMALVEKKLGEPGNSDLRSVFQVLPLTTIDKGQPDKGKGLDAGCFNEDKKFIDNFIGKKGSVVLGWQNQDSNDKTDSKFAIGGGRADKTKNNKMSKDQSKTIQEYLQTLRDTHPMGSEKKVGHAMGTEKSEKSLSLYALEVVDAKNSGNEMAVKNALDAQKEALSKEIAKSDTNPQRRSSLERDLTSVEKELSTLPLRTRSSASAQPPKPQVPTLPAAPKWNTVGHKASGALSGAMQTLNDLTNAKKAQSNTGDKPKPLPLTPSPKLGK
jgi:hypothetical protein